MLKIKNINSKGLTSLMDLSQIKAFLAVAQEGSFTRASKLVNLSQPSVSLKVKALEKDLGTNLIIRDQHNIHLSEDGKIAADKLQTIVDELTALKLHFESAKLEKEKKITIFHTPFNSQSGLEKLLILCRDIGSKEIKLSTQSCTNEDQIIKSLEENHNAIGLTTSVQTAPFLCTSTIQSEELMLLCHEHDTFQEKSIDLCELFDQHLWLPELGSETLKLFEAKLQPLGLELTDFIHRDHISETMMLELIRSGEGKGIALSNQKSSQLIQKIRINEFSIPYGIYANINVKANGATKKIFQSIANANPVNQQSDRPLLDRTIISQRQHSSQDEPLSIRIGIQSRTVQTMLAGRVIQKLGLYESFLSSLNKSSLQSYATLFKDYQSAAPILTELEAGTLDIAVVGDYAIAHIANSLKKSKENIVLVGFASINPMGSGSRLMIHKSSGSHGLEGLRDQSIHVPFLSTAHGSLLYNLKVKGMLAKTELINLALDSRKLNKFNHKGNEILTCFTPFDHFLESEFGYQKIEDQVSMPFSFYGIIARQSFALEHPDSITAFLKANLCSNYWFNTTPSSIRHLSQWTGVKESIINQIIGERQGNDCYYMHDMTIRQDWVQEFTSKLFVESELNINQIQLQTPIIMDDYLVQARKDLGLISRN